MQPLNHFKQIFEDEKYSLEYLMDHNVIVKPTECQNCGYNFFSRVHKTWRCTIWGCKKSVSMLCGTFLADSKLKVKKCLLWHTYGLRKCPEIPSE
jgi:predicted Zn-ribbon and HTH transcriptional regulator